MNDLADFVEAYEQAQTRDGRADLVDFLPPEDHPLYPSVVRELIRVDLEYGWRRGAPRPLDDYRRAFPDVFRRPEVLEEVAFEEYRLRRQKGEPATPAEYAQRYGVRAGDWPGPPSLATPSWLPGAHLLPPAGTRFLGFELLAELGQGTFGRVYLARQTVLANRLVVLKASADVDREVQTLAQLVHTHIVPVYSFHREPPYQAACMPYLGATTLAHVLEQLSRQTTLPRSGKALVSTITHQSHLVVPSGYDRLPPTVPTTPAPVLPDLPSAETVAPLRLGRGSTVTLDMLEGLTYVEAVLWLGSCLADGLAHAHERGIVHRDLKPANVLLTDEGLPMLLDFNLAEDRARGSAEGSRLGGTLAYMAPEHLEAFRGREAVVDGRSDLYSLGILLFQLLTRRHPFRAQARGADVKEMLAERRQPPPRLRNLEPCVSASVEAIVRKCLEPDPARRYQHARELHEDLERQRQNRPLRHAGNPSPWERCVKWYRRHPRLAIGSAVTLLAGTLLAVVLGGYVRRGQELARTQAVEAREAFENDFRLAQFYLNTRADNRDLLEEGCRRARACLDRFGVLDRPDWQHSSPCAYLSPREQQSLREDVAETLLLLARAEERLAETLPPEGRALVLRQALDRVRQAEEYFDESQAPALLWQLQAELHERAGRLDEALGLRARAAQVKPETSRALYLDGIDQAAAGRYQAAIPLLEKALRREPGLFAACFGLGFCHESLGQAEQALVAYSSAIALRPDFSRAWLSRGQIHLRRREATLAERDFDEVIRLEPTLADAHVNRALARQQQADREAGAPRRKQLLEKAVADLTTALELKTAHTRVYFIRAQLRDRLGDPSGAQADRQRGLALTPNDENSLVARGIARLESKDVPGALADFDEALKRNPWSYPALRNKASVLAERQGKLAEAVRILDRAIDRYPDFVVLRGGRAVYHARLGHRRQARIDVRECLQRDTSPFMMYQMAGVHSLLSRSAEDDDHRAGLRLFASALRGGFDQFALIESDPDLVNLRRDDQYRRLLRAARALAASQIPASHRGEAP